MKYAEILHRCFRCGYCKFTLDYENFNCPPYRKYRFDTFAPGGRMWLIRAWLNGEIENSERFPQFCHRRSDHRCRMHFPGDPPKRPLADPGV